MKQSVKNVVAAAVLSVSGLGVANAQVPALPVDALSGLTGILDLGGGLGDLTGILDLGGGLGGLTGILDLGGGGLGGLTGILDLGGGGDLFALIPLDITSGLGGGLPLDGLANLGGGFGGGLESIPVLGPVLDLILNGDFIEKMMPSPKVDQLLGGGTALLFELGPGAIANPASILSTVNELGVNAGTAAVPVLAVLMENPAGLLDYFQSGGTILFQAINGTDGNSIIPGIPLISMPLSL